MGRGVWVPACAGTTKSILATHCARALPETSRPLQSEGAGNAGCALHPRSRVRFALKQSAHEHTGQRRTSDIPCAMALRLISCSPRRRVLDDSVAAGQLLTSLQLDACHGRQDHTLLPYASVALRLRDISVHRSPPNVRDDGRRPSDQDGMAKNEPLI